LDGILNLDKPKGWTSHDVVASVRRLTRMRRVGHAGTLDPLAGGVLLVCLGRATRVAEYLVAGRKRYRAVIHLGVSTDSHDADGQVTGTAPLRSSRAEVEAALTHFCGAIQQVPPMVSAIKRDGQPLYKLARRGITIARAARPVEIYQLTLTDWSPPHLTLELTSSPGTYVRALARDLGQRLGCGAHLSALTRLSSGNFKLKQAINLEQFAAAVAEGNWHHLILPIDAGLGHFPVCTLDAQESRRVRSGQSLAARLISAPKDQLCRAYATHGDEKRLLALLKFDHDTHSWRPHKVFHPL
jgi:tRNA pseudouridine55 synthase